MSQIAGGTNYLPEFDINADGILSVSATDLASNRQPVAAVTSSFCVVMSVAAVCYVTVLWLLVVRSIWAVVLLASVAYLSTSIVVVGIFAAGNEEASDYLITRLILVTATLSVGAMIAMVMVRKHFLRLEWARLM